MYLAVDPGKGAVDSIGVATFSNTGKTLFIGQYTFDNFVNYLEKLSVDGAEIAQVIYEDYRIFKRKANAHIGSRVETVQSIGALKAWCIRNSIPCEAQASDILPVAQKLFQIKLPVDHTISHQFSALLHGMYWLHLKGLVKSALELEIEHNKTM